MYICTYSFYLFVCLLCVLESRRIIKIILKLNAKIYSQISKFSGGHRESSHKILNNFMLTNWHVETISLFVARWWTDV